jgi:hypothetical protein
VSLKRLLAWGMVVFSVVSTPLALFWFAKNEPPFVVILSELALIYTALDVLWQAEQMEE